MFDPESFVLWAVYFLDQRRDEYRYSFDRVHFRLPDANTLYDPDMARG